MPNPRFPGQADRVFSFSRRRELETRCGGKKIVSIGIYIVTRFPKFCEIIPGQNSLVPDRLSFDRFAETLALRSL